MKKEFQIEKSENGMQCKNDVVLVRIQKKNLVVLSV